jgi:quercetin dioxygenase-like cupin family protein
LPARYHKEFIMPVALVTDLEKPLLQSLADACPIPPGGVTSRPLVHVAGLRQILFAMDSGQEMSPHHAPYVAMVHVLSGAMEFDVVDKHFSLQAGDWLYLPKDAMHALRATEPTRFLLTLVRE